MPPTPYDQLSPAEIAVSDQELSAGREQARAGTPILAIIYPSPGDTCCAWGCGEAATYILCSLYGTPDQDNWSMCTNHYGPLVSVMAEDHLGAGGFVLGQETA